MALLKKVQDVETGVSSSWLHVPYVWPENSEIAKSRTEKIPSEHLALIAAALATSLAPLTKHESTQPWNTSSKLMSLRNATWSAKKS